MFCKNALQLRRWNLKVCVCVCQYVASLHFKRKCKKVKKMWEPHQDTMDSWDKPLPLCTFIMAPFVSRNRGSLESMKNSDSASIESCHKKDIKRQFLRNHCYYLLRVANKLWYACSNLPWTNLLPTSLYRVTWQILAPVRYPGVRRRGWRSLATEGTSPVDWCGIDWKSWRWNRCKRTGDEWCSSMPCASAFSHPSSRFGWANGQHPRRVEMEEGSEVKFCSS